MLSLWVWELFPGYPMPCRNTNICHWGKSYRMSFCVWGFIFFFPRVNTTFQFFSCGIHISVQMSRRWDSLRGEENFASLFFCLQWKGGKKRLRKGSVKIAIMMEIVHWSYLKLSPRRSGMHSVHRGCLDGDASVCREILERVISTLVKQ